MYNGSEFYDNESNFVNYQKRREWNENANDTIEKPIIEQLIGEVIDKNILDLGCGNASFGNDLLDRGCLSYTGIEGSRNMFDLAKINLNRENVKVIHSTIEEWNFPESYFQLVVSRLALHYINKLEKIFSKIYKSLDSEGSFVFSVEHPVMTSSYGTNHSEGQKNEWIVDNYFHTGLREQKWLGGTAIKYHRTIEQYYTILRNVGFKVEDLRESMPCRENFINQETYERRMKIPLFLFMVGKKS